MTDNTATALPALPESVQRLKAALEALEALAPINNMATDGELFRLFHRRIDAAAAFVHAASPEAIRALLDAASAVRASAGAVEVPAEPMARFCPGCGSVGPVPKQYRDCCPDGNKARVIPESLARDCHDLFHLALRAPSQSDEALPAAPSALTARPAVALTEEQIVDEALRPCYASDAVIDWLTAGVRFAERMHGIPSAPSANERKE